MLDKLTKTQCVDFHLVPRPICGYIKFVHNQGTLTHSALFGREAWLHEVWKTPQPHQRGQIEAETRSVGSQTSLASKFPSCDRYTQAYTYFFYHKIFHRIYEHLL